MHEHNFNLFELDSMVPWEREIYVALLTQKIEAQNARNTN